jgi:cytochrome c oxidase assembly protein subunit 15
MSAISTASAARRRASRAEDRGVPRPAVAIWLFTVAAVVMMMVLVGGATRLTGSGLSITQWKPISGILPPRSAADWDHLFYLYRQLPQYRLLNKDMSLADFKVIYWWEWGHRLIARLLGVVFFAPFVAFAASGQLSNRMLSRCLALFVLGGAQGVAGWWMVASGLEARTAVAPERLALHLGLALLLFSALILVGLEAWTGQPPAMRPTRDPRRWATAGFALGVYIQCLMGALVAGNGAGLVHADWPLMDGRWFPADYWAGSVMATLFHGVAAVQFHHRILAYGLFLWALVLALWFSRASGLRHPAKALAFLCAGLVLLQVGLGVMTLWGGVPLSWALAHQMNAALLLAAATGLAWFSAQKTTGIQLPYRKIR